MNRRFVLLTGCSGGGKSTLLQALSERGFATVQEPGRRIVAEQLAGAGDALPWVDMKAFARRAIEVALSDLEAAQSVDDIVFFDRGLIDAAVALAHAGGPTIEQTLGETLVYERRVFIVPPWRQLFAADAERRHGFDAAVQEHHRIEKALETLGYLPTELPKVAVQERAEFVLKDCGVL
ncbi:Predicted ATPase [Pseudooceanicola antarcticus]|uniref:Predicted ATPase n=1 Tax=Pseudooceanicola antarcticus TaxID=1247613 RepID=A0A285IWY9_9RHOB|nr:AAA family ATPase [Pseudooceanicola antarcticus]SNY52514.1 Predicted ATPase [Pseudooceanicola antarcticus]